MGISNDSSGKTAAQIITESLLKAQGIIPNGLSSNKPETSTSLKGIQESINQAIAKRKSKLEYISTLEFSLNNLENQYSKKQSGLLNRLFTKQEVIDDIGKQVEESRSSINEVKNELENCCYDIDYLIDPKIEDIYSKVVSAFTKLCGSAKIWNITSSTVNNDIKSSAASVINRSEVSYSLQKLDYITSKYPALSVPNHDGYNIYIYPTFLLLTNNNESIELIDFKELKFSFRSQRFLEPENSRPADANIIDQTWAKVNKDGSRDLRFLEIGRAHV